MRGSRISATSVFIFTALCLGCGDGETEKFKKIELKEVYASHTQKGLKELDLSTDLPFNETTIKPFADLGPRASNLFLTHAKNVERATENALRFNGGNDGGRRLILAEKENSIWLVVFLGINCSTPPQWKLESVEYNSSKIRVTFWKEWRGGQRTRDSQPYLFLVPMNDLKLGDYDLELRESSKGEITLMRKVRVEEGKE